MHRTLALATVAVALASLAGCATEEVDEAFPQFTSMHLEVEAQENGEVVTEIDMTYDFHDVESHGIYLEIDTYRAIEGDATRERYTPVISWGTSSSDDGGLQNIRAQRGRQGTSFHFGDQERTVTGEHSYGLRYRMEGLVDSGTGVDGADEIHWNIIGHRFKEPIDDIEILFTGPGEILTAECWAGRAGSTDACGSLDHQGSALTIHHDRLEVGEGITLALAFEPGSFLPQEPQYAPLPPPGTPTWVFILITIGVVLVFGGGTYMIVAWIYRDEKYVSEIPGLDPAKGSGAEVGKAGIFKPRPPVAFAPPEGVTPNQAAALEDPTRVHNVVSATIIDLAVRGYLTVTTLEKGIELRKVRELPEEGVTPSQRFVFDTLFAADDTRQILQPKPQMPAALARTGGIVLWELEEKKWLKGGHEKAQKVLRWVSMAGFLPLAIILGQMAKSEAWDGVAVFAAPTAIFGGLGLALGTMYRRTAAGYARYEQILAFKKYLRRAEKHQLQFEADTDVFSRYLPHAIAFGLVTQWVSAFERMQNAEEYRLPWFNGGSVSMLTNITARKAFFDGIGGANIVSRFRSGVTSTGGGGVGTGLSGGGGGRW